MTTTKVAANNDLRFETHFRKKAALLSSGKKKGRKVGGVFSKCLTETDWWRTQKKK
jgi:hypothetical protein